MSRGRVSEKALIAAVMAAAPRGEIIHFRPVNGEVFAFLISTRDGFAAVCVRRELRIRSCVPEIAVRHAGVLTRISTSELPRAVFRELHLWCPHGSMRFFRIDGRIITELDRSGQPLSPPVNSTFAGIVRGRCARKLKDFSRAVPTRSPVPENIPAPVPLQNMPAPAWEQKNPADNKPAKGKIKEPAPARYLRKTSAARTQSHEQKNPRVPGAPDEPEPGKPPPPGGACVRVFFIRYHPIFERCPSGVILASDGPNTDIFSADNAFFSVLNFQGRRF